MRPFSALIPLTVFLISCAPHQPAPQPIPPAIALIPDPPPLDIKDCEWLLPVDEGAGWTLIPGRTWKGKSCGDYNEDQWKDKAFQERCLRHPPLVDANVVYGVDKTQYACFQHNEQELKKAITWYRKQFEDVNQKIRAIHRAAAAKTSGP